MFISFTQTYGNERTMLMDISFRDQKLIDLKNSLDLNIFSFHNTSDYIVDKFIEENPYKNVHIVRFKDISYTDTFKKVLDFLKNHSCSQFLFIQDDGFSYLNESLDIEEFVNYIRMQKNRFLLSLARSFCAGHHLDPQKRTIFSGKSFSVHNYTTFDLKELGFWAFDDQPYICSSDLLSEIYDDGYFKTGDIWAAEFYLYNKFTNIEFPRFVTDKELFKNYNIIGKTLDRKEFDLKILRDKKLLDI